MTIVPFLSDEDLARVRAIHPTSDVQALLAMPSEELHYTLRVARDLYHEGHAIDGRHGYRLERLAMVAEVLELRARFARLDPASRRALVLPPQRFGKPPSCVFRLGDA